MTCVKYTYSKGVGKVDLSDDLPNRPIYRKAACSSKLTILTDRSTGKRKQAMFFSVTGSTQPERKQKKVMSCGR
jgi:hypothetical protein